MPQLEYQYVAFLDVLGFAAMVRHDCESPAQEVRYLTRLLEVHTATADSFPEGSGRALQQFSDSVVISAPYDPAAFPEFVADIGAYQRMLLEQDVLCRGGIAHGKHYSDGSFLFSQGLVDAYRLESTTARFPRVVVSSDLLSLLYPQGIPDHATLPLLLASDGAWFVDYLFGVDEDDLAKIASEAAEQANSYSAGVAEKHHWLSQYADHQLGQIGDGRGPYATPTFRCADELDGLADAV